jgi:hypothetical protein
VREKDPILVGAEDQGFQDFRMQALVEAIVLGDRTQENAKEVTVLLSSKPTE